MKVVGNKFDPTERAHTRAHILLDALHPLTAEQRALVLVAISTLFAIEDRHDLEAQKKRLVAAIRREVAVRADELKGRGVSKPITQAWKDVAERHGYQSGPALKRSVNRNR
jgi:hypothetical protein